MNFSSETKENPSPSLPSPSLPSLSSPSVLLDQEDKESLQELEGYEEALDQSHELAYAGWIGRAMARAPKIIASQRWMAYSSEGTEPFRPVASKWFVRSGYALSVLYVASDVGVRTKATYISSGENKKETGIVFGDTLLFHSFASLLIPAVLIHQIVHQVSNGLKRVPNLLAKFPRTRSLIPTAIGLCSIPFVVGPIDHGTEWVMDNTIRNLYEYEKHFDHEH